MTEPDNGTIRFTVKELLAKVDEKLDVISKKLDAKADAAEVARIDDRVAAVEKELGENRVVAAALLLDKKKRFTTREKVLAALVVAFQLAVSVAALGPDII